MEKKERNFQTRTSASAQGTMASAPSQMASVSVRPQGDVIDLQELFWVLVDKWKVIFLALEKDPLLSNVEIKMMLRDSCDDMGLPRNQQGWGKFNCKRFLAL